MIGSMSVNEFHVREMRYLRKRGFFEQWVAMRIARGGRTKGARHASQRSRANRRKTSR